MFLQAPPYHSKTKLQQQHSFVEVATSYHQLFAAADSINSPYTCSGIHTKHLFKLRHILNLNLLARLKYAPICLTKEILFEKGAHKQVAS
jgi:hypothetical protein